METHLSPAHKGPVQTTKTRASTLHFLLQSFETLHNIYFFLSLKRCKLTFHSADVLTKVYKRGSDKPKNAAWVTGTENRGCVPHASPGLPSYHKTAEGREEEGPGAASGKEGHKPRCHSGLLCHGSPVLPQGIL